MSIWDLLGSLFLQCMLGGFLLMFVGFSACGIGNCRKLRKWQEYLLGACMVIVPGSSAVVAVWQIVLYCKDLPGLLWWQQALPAGVGALYLLFAIVLNHSGSDRYGQRAEQNENSAQ